MKDYHQILIPGGYFHIYNHAIGNDKMFIEKENYYFFSKGILNILVIFLKH